MATVLSVAIRVLWALLVWLLGLLGRGGKRLGRFGIGGERWLRDVEQANAELVVALDRLESELAHREAVIARLEARLRGDQS